MACDGCYMSTEGSYVVVTTEPDTTDYVTDYLCGDESNAGMSGVCAVLFTFILWYGDGAGNTIEENSSVFSGIRMR